MFLHPLSEFLKKWNATDYLVRARERHEVDSRPRVKVTYNGVCLLRVSRTTVTSVDMIGPAARISCSNGCRRPNSTSGPSTAERAAAHLSGILGLLILQRAQD